MKQIFGINQNQLSSLLRYLASKPYGEVAQFIQELNNLPVITLNETKAEDGDNKTDETAGA